MIESLWYVPSVRLCTIHGTWIVVRHYLPYRIKSYIEKESQSSLTVLTVAGRTWKLSTKTLKAKDTILNINQTRAVYRSKPCRHASFLTLPALCP